MAVQWLSDEPDGDVDLADFTMFAIHWLASDCDLCGIADLTGNGQIQLFDETGRKLAG